MDWIKNNWADIWMIFSSVVAIASIVAKLTPNKWDDNFVARVVQFLALTKK